ncbi:MAG TPA: hypothetical protein VF796_13115 [Humisphaera sp.]
MIGGKTFVWFDEYADVVATGPNASNMLWVRWWREARPHVDVKVEERLKMYRVEQQGLSVGGTNDSDRRIKALGIVALPKLMEHVRLGEGDLVRWVSEITGGAIPPDAGPGTAREWWDAHRAEWEVPVPAE